MNKEHKTIKLFYKKSLNLTQEEHVLINLFSKHALFLYSFIKVNTCSAYFHMVQGQVQAYRIENEKFHDSIETMVTDGYLRENETKYPGGGDITIDAEGKVLVSEI